jgi:hypothetical protein
MSDGHQDYNGVASFRGGRGINAGWDIDVEAGFIRNEMLFEDVVETLLVVLSKEDVVCRKFCKLSVERPIERYAGAGGLSFEEGFSKHGGRQKVVVRVSQISVADYYICCKWFLALVFENNSRCAFTVLGELYVANGAIKHKLYA